MGVAVMQVRIMWMLVRDRCMTMTVHMRLLPVPREIMRMLVMFVMTVQVFMRDRFMRVFMLVMLGHVQPDAEGHQCRRNPERRRGGFAGQHQ